MDNKWISNYINEISEDETDPQEIKVGNYQTKYFHVCPGASKLYGDIESKGVDMDMAERSARLQDALYFVEEHIQRDGYNPEKDYVMVAKNIAKNIMKMAEMMGLEKEHDYIQGHVDTIEKVVNQKGLEERVIELTEENVPTNPSKWSYYKAQAKKKFDVYPSAYANAWAAKQYKAAGGGWKTKKKESIDEAKSMDMKKRLKVYDKLKKGDEITIKYGSSMSSGREGKFKVTKGKTVVGKQKVERIILQNVANPKGVKYYLYQRNGNVTMAIGDMGATIEDMHESVNEVNGPLNKKVKKYLDTYLKGTKTNSPEHQEAVMLIMKGALTDANFHSEAKKLSKYFPKAKGKYSGTPMEGVIEDKGIDIAKMAKWDGHDIIDAFAFYLSMSIGGSFGNRLMSLKEGIGDSEVIEEAEYQGRKVKLNSPMQGDSKKFKVYVKNAKGNVVVVHFGQKGMNIKKNNPKARKSFRARMNCDNPGPKWKANYWSCKKW